MMMVMMNDTMMIDGMTLDSREGLAQHIIKSCVDNVPITVYPIIE